MSLDKQSPLVEGTVLVVPETSDTVVKTHDEMMAELDAIKKKRAEEKDKWDGEVVKLRDKYIEPPFSVLDTKSGSWQKRKAAWLAMGIKSEVGRNVAVLPGKTTNNYMPDMATSTSVFDPALCELMYTWFCPTGGVILDPFAGGSVRGIVAHKMGYKYIGIELRKEQVESNIEQAKEILPADNQPTWICGDSDVVLDDLIAKNTWIDFVFSCPPYFDLEVYSNDPDDLSNMDYRDFLKKYNKIIEKSWSLLDQGGYGVFVVGEVRNEKGYYIDFVGDTKRAFMNEAGARFYNDFVLLDPIGTAMIRASNFGKNKKAVKVHQNVLCFFKPL